MTERDERISRLLGVRGHLDGCPGEDDLAATRVEAYELGRPVVERVHDPEWDESRDVVVRQDPVAVVRCVDCGGTRTYDRALDELLDQNGGRP